MTFFALLSMLMVDFTFNVPVSLQDYVQPSSVSGSTQSVYCAVLAGTTEIGRGHTPVAIPASGNYNATVSVQVTVAAGHRASDATDYKCWFAVADNAPADTYVTRGELRARGGTTPVLLVTGHIPR